MTDRSIVFTHIPKAAGSALSLSLHKALQPRRPVSGFDHAIFGGFDGFGTISDDQRRHIYGRPDQLPGDADLIAGHFATGTTRLAYPDARHMTVLREPIARLLSQWVYWRAQDEASLAGWGEWGDRVRTAHQTLSAFLSEPTAACQTDNLALRMLVWPHPLVPGDGFIAPEDDDTLLHAACASLDSYDHVDIVESARLEDRLQGWLGREFTMERVNETQPVPTARRTNLDKEMTVEALVLLERRSRLDAVLWRVVADTLMGPADVAALRTRTLLRTTARHAHLLA